MGGQSIGPQFIVNGWAAKVLAVLLTGLIGWTAYENLQSMIFRHQGERCTALDCANLDNRIARNHEEIEHLRLELQRQQVQIDRLEGHKAKSYTEDEK